MGVERLHIEEVSYLYSTTIMQVIKSNMMGGHVACMGDSRGAHRILVFGPEGKTQLGRRRNRWWDNIKLYLQ